MDLLVPLETNLEKDTKVVQVIIVPLHLFTELNETKKKAEIS